MQRTQRGARGEPAIRLRHVGVSYRRRAGFARASMFWALRDVSLDLFHGETLGIIGRNGVGKSTLLRVLAGIIAPDRGEMVSDGCRASLLSLQVGFIPHLTGRENAMLSGMLLGLSRRAMLDGMESIIGFAEQEEFIDQPVSTYSAGMRARLGFSVAFMAKPDVLLVDEILGVGDEGFRAKSTAAMRDRLKSNQTVVLVSHSAPTVRELCNRVIWIEGGATFMAGPTDEVMDAYEKKLRPAQPVQAGPVNAARQR